MRLAGHGNHIPPPLPLPVSNGFAVPVGHQDIIYAWHSTTYASLLEISVPDALDSPVPGGTHRGNYEDQFSIILMALCYFL